MCCITSISGLHIRFICPIVGSQSHIVGYERMEAAYDVAVQQSMQIYPALFHNFSMTRHFVPGNFTCAESDAKITEELGKLMAEQIGNSKLTSRNPESEFRVILSPGLYSRLTIFLTVFFLYNEFDIFFKDAHLRLLH
jgi:hypothetical protein